MARLTESQLAGFRTGTGTPAVDNSSTAPREPEARPHHAPAHDVGADQPALTFGAGTPSTSSSLGPVPPAPTRGQARLKVGLTLPVELASEVRAINQQGYAFADLVMVAYQHHRDALVEGRQNRSTRQLERRTVGRSSFTVVLSVAERDALDALARRLETTRSQTVAVLLDRHLSSQQPVRGSATRV